MTTPAPCTCCSCDSSIIPNPDPYCRQHTADGVVKRQCDLHGWPGTCWGTNPIILRSVQDHLAGIPDPE
jgi:hypothetical protein